MADVDYGGPRPEDQAHCGRGAARQRAAQPSAGAKAPRIRLSGARLRRGGRSRSCLRLCAGLLLAYLAGFTAPAAGAEASAQRSSRWIFAPLGPEGAAVAEIHALGSELWALRTQEGEIFLRRAIARSGQGAWEPFPLPDGVPLARKTFSWDGGLAFLAPDGALFTAVFEAPAGGSGNAASGIEPSRGEGTGVPRRSPVIRRLGMLPADEARGVVALVRRKIGDAPGNATDHVLLFTRDGHACALSADGYHSWPIRLETPFPSVTGHAASARVALRGAWALPGDPAGVVVLTEWEGLFVSRDGGHTFSPVEGGLPKEVRTLGVLHGSRPALLAGAASRIFSGTASALAWTPRGQLPPAGADAEPHEATALAMVAEGGDVLLAATAAGELFRSVDGGASWHFASFPGSAPISAIAVEGREVRVATSRGVLCSHDAGSAWEWWNQGLRRVTVEAISVAKDGGGSILLSTNLGLFELGGGPGGSWTHREDRVDSVFVGESAQADLGADGGGDGDIATSRVSGPPGQRVLEFARAPLERDWLFARTPDGVFASRDGGASWQEVPLPADLAVTRLAVDLANRRLLLGTRRYGLLAADLPRDPLPLQAVLPVHASPNPFGHSVVLRCGIPADALSSGGRAPGSFSRPSTTRGGTEAAAAGPEERAELLILSVHGQLIRRLPAPIVMSDPLGGQSLLWRWDGLDEQGQPAASGMYLVSGSAGESWRFTGKLIKLD